MASREHETDAVLILDEPWIPPSGRIGSMTVRRGSVPSLRYPDGIELEVVALDAATIRSVEDAIAATDRRRPGQVILLTGAVPLDWRADLRRAGVSFLSRTGAAEIRWPRLVTSAHRFEGDDDHRRTPVPLQKSRAIVAQDLLARGPDQPASLTEIAEATGASISTVSRAVTQLAAQGLAERRRRGRAVLASVAAPKALLSRLAERTPWPAEETIAGYRWGRIGREVARGACAAARGRGVAVAATGRVGAEALGVRATSSARTARLWIAPGLSPDEVLVALDAEPAPVEEANLFVAVDRRGYGLHGAELTSGADPLCTSHPVRVWCDLQDEPRGPELADDLWRVAGGW